MAACGACRPALQGTHLAHPTWCRYPCRPRPKFACVVWNGGSIPVKMRMKGNVARSTCAKYFKGCQVTIQAHSLDDVTEKAVTTALLAAGGSHPPDYFEFGVPSVRMHVRRSSLSSNVTLAQLRQAHAAAAPAAPAAPAPPPATQQAVAAPTPPAAPGPPSDPAPPPVPAPGSPPQVPSDTAGGGEGGATSAGAGAGAGAGASAGDGEANGKTPGTLDTAAPPTEVRRTGSSDSASRRRQSVKTPLARKRGEKKRGRGAIFGGGGTIFRGENVIGEEVSEDYAGDEVKHMEDEYVV